MGYTHYWYRPEELPEATFITVAKDLLVLRSELEKGGYYLAGWDGTGEPEINETKISFNGKRDCGHQRRNLGIAWPAAGAKGASPDGQPAGSWFAGAQLSTRTCGGDCSHETFLMERIVKRQDWATPRPDGFVFSCCKTAFKPYDLAVTAALVIAKQHFGKLIEVHSDGDEENWNDAREICMALFEYGSTFRLPRGEGEDE